MSFKNNVSSKIAEAYFLLCPDEEAARGPLIAFTKRSIRNPLPQSILSLQKSELPEPLQVKFSEACFAFSNEVRRDSRDLGQRIFRWSSPRSSIHLTPNFVFLGTVKLIQLAVEIFDVALESMILQEMKEACKGFMITMLVVIKIILCSEKCVLKMNVPRRSEVRVSFPKSYEAVKLGFIRKSTHGIQNVQNVRVQPTIRGRRSNVDRFWCNHDKCICLPMNIN